MSFREVRQGILEEHRVLRLALADVESLRGQLEAGDEGVAVALQEAGRALYQRFAAHLTLEDRTLVSSVRDMAGSAIAEQITREHQEQRELLAYLLGRLGHRERPVALLARELQEFSTLLHEDMREEEALLLRLDAVAGGHGFPGN